MLFGIAPLCSGKPWTRHVIDGSSVGADGVRLADADGDGFPDITTGWEEGGVIRVYLNPGPLRAKRAWPAVTVGRVASPEDAVLVDLDDDGRVDVVSACEGEERSLFVHWAPKWREDYRIEKRWRTAGIGASKGVQWMFTLPLEVDFRRGLDLVAGGKGPGAAIGWFEAPENPRETSAWQWHPVYRAGWVMSLLPSDMDGDGDLDILASDRKGQHPGALWLENPGPGPVLAARWPEHRIGATGEEVMFLAETDLDQDGQRDVVAAVRPKTIYYFRRISSDGTAWESHRIPIPEQAGTAKGVQAGDLDGDGKLDLIFSCEKARGKLSGVMWLSYSDSSWNKWEAHDISGPDGVKFDLVELLDLDDDGDLDVLTCEERANLGVIWYENPRR